MKAHEAALDFPLSLEGLTHYDAILLSDIGSNTLLLHPDVWLQGKTVPNRLKLLKEYSARGGGLMMIGGYFSFQGIDGRARWHKTAVEEVLPVTCIPYDDRFEAPEGIVAEITMPSHPIVSGLDTPWPALLGVNEVKVKERQDVQVIARLPADQGGHPLLVAGSHGNGRTLAWTSDIGPHWLPNLRRMAGLQAALDSGTGLAHPIVVPDAPFRKRLQGYHVSRGDPAETGRHLMRASHMADWAAKA
jgi:uncharacterized membrane protein